MAPQRLLNQAEQEQGWMVLTESGLLLVHDKQKGLACCWCFVFGSRAVVRCVLLAFIYFFQNFKSRGSVVMHVPCNSLLLFWHAYTLTQAKPSTRGRGSLRSKEDRESLRCVSIQLSSRVTLPPSAHAQHD